MIKYLLALKDFVLKRKKIFLILIVVLVGLFIWQQQVKAKKAKETVKTTSVIKKDLIQSISATGKVKADEEVTLKFQTSGNLAWVGVKKGDHVNKWQALAGLDQKELEKKLKQELIDFMNQRTDVEQTDANYQDKSYDAATLETIRRTKDKVGRDLDRTVLDVEIQDIALKYSTLITPIDGIITKIDAPYAGVNITPTTAEFVVSNPDKLIFSANVDEGDIGKIQIGKLAKIVLDAYPDESFNATVEQVEFTPTLTSGGGTAYAVKFLLPPNSNEKFKLGMNGDVEIILEQKNQVLTIPSEAVQGGNDNKYVWVQDNNHILKKEVTIGFANDSESEILSGLNENNQVVTSGFKNLKI